MFAFPAKLPWLSYACKRVLSGYPRNTPFELIFREGIFCCFTNSSIEISVSATSAFSLNSSTFCLKSEFFSQRHTVTRATPLCQLQVGNVGLNSQLITLDYELNKKAYLFLLMRTNNLCLWRYRELCTYRESSIVSHRFLLSSNVGGGQAANHSRSGKRTGMKQLDSGVFSRIVWLANPRLLFWWLGMLAGSSHLS